MNGDGLKLVIIGVVLAIVATLFDGTEFTITFWSEDLVDYFKNIGDIFKSLGDMFDFSIYFGLYMLWILVFLIGLVLALVGMKNIVSLVGGILLLYLPIVMILMAVDADMIKDILSLDYLNLYLMLAGGILCIIGGIKNKE